MSEQFCRLLCGDSREMLKSLETASVDALVSDPPSGIHMMGLSWDSDKGGRDQWIAWLAGIMAECRRVCKPGAHALIWALPRTSHWTATALEDSGWAIREICHHIHAQGFPKSNSQLKPAVEHWILARAPFRGSERACVERWGTGALNIEACRVSTTPEDATAMARCNTTGSGRFKSYVGPGDLGRKKPGVGLDTTQGRHPANLVLQHSALCGRRGTKRVKVNDTAHDRHGSAAKKGWKGGFVQEVVGVGCADPDGTEAVADWLCVDSCPIRILDAQAGERTSGLMKARTRRANLMGFNGAMPAETLHDTYADSGNVSRFFTCLDPDTDPGFRYESKASQGERSKGLAGRNPNIAVKSLALMNWLVQLVSKPGDVILDPFLGSGTTLVAAASLGRSGIGIEQDPEMLEVARQRLGLLASLEEAR